MQFRTLRRICPDIKNACIHEKVRKYKELEKNIYYFLDFLLSSSFWKFSKITILAIFTKSHFFGKIQTYSRKRNILTKSYFLVK